MPGGGGRSETRFAGVVLLAVPRECIDSGVYVFSESSALSGEGRCTCDAGMTRLPHCSATLLR